MDKEIIIFCDESDSRGQYYSNFYGGVLVGSSKYLEISDRLNYKKQQLHFFGEVKWEKVSERYLDKYIQLVQAFFKEVKKGNVKVRIMFTQNYYVPQLAPEGKDVSYFKLYYQFIKNSFGLTFIPPAKNDIILRLLFDVFPHKKERIEQFKGFLLALNKNEWFKKSRIILLKENIAEVKSHDHVLLQCLDIVLGSINFRLNDKHKQKDPQTNKRGKKTIAKEKLYKEIYKEISSIHPKFNIGISTGINGKKENKWALSYLHWKFIPDNFTVDDNFSKGKKAKK